MGFLWTFHFYVCQSLECSTRGRLLRLWKLDGREKDVCRQAKERFARRAEARASVQSERRVPVLALQGLLLVVQVRDPWAAGQGPRRDVRGVRAG